MGSRNSIIGFHPADLGGLMENVVYNHLIADGYNVKVGSLSQEREIDFIADKGNELHYIQVSLAVGDERTAARAFGNLERIPDNYEKIVVILIDSAPNTFNGIRLMSLRELLMS